MATGPEAVLAEIGLPQSVRLKQADLTGDLALASLGAKPGLHQSVFDSTPDGLILVDMGTAMVVEVNAAACAMHGYTREELVGMLPEAFIHADSQPAFRDYVGAFRSGAFREMLLLHVRRDGSTFYTEWHGTAIIYPDRLCLLGALRDVSPALQERQRLARNLHDAVNQSLFSAGLIAEVLPRLWDRDQVEARQSLEDLRRLARGALAEMRELLAELRPSVLTDSSPGDLLRQLASAFTGRTNIPASVTVKGSHLLSAELQVALYRICQEALHNITKHAGASRVAIDLRIDGGAGQASWPTAPTRAPQLILASSAEMQIRDDGHGFDPAPPTASGHYGLDMMRERAEAVGARLTVASRPAHGTEIAVGWPAPPKQEAR